MSSDLDAALSTLKAKFGFDHWRPGQAEVLEAIFAGENILAVMPTGAGKSLCYQLPAVVRRELTIVVSPLIALMRDQVQQMHARGIAAAALNSANSGAENAALDADLRQGRLRLVYVAPERLVRPDTIALLRRAGATVAAIDEAHCVSQWGHDFRPEYLALRDAIEAIGVRQLIAVTATADAPTRQEIVKKLFPDAPRIFVRSFDRPNLRLAMARKVDAARQLEPMVERYRGQSGIIYCASRKGVEALAARLSAAGHYALPYHAGMEPSLRSANQDEFLRNTGVVVVATIAFGMGIDKSDVRFVCHADLPQSIESYYQEIGRAGRDGLPADTLTLFGESDIRLRERQILQSDAPAERKVVERRRLQALIALCETPRCRRQTLLAAFGEPAEPCGNCDICEGGSRFFNGAVAAQKVMSAILRTSGRFFPGHLANLLVGRTTEAIRRHGHDQLPTFGVGKEFDAAGWRSIFRQLHASDLIAQDPDDRDRWTVTEAGRAVLAGNAELALRGEAPGSGRRAKRALETFDRAARQDPGGGATAYAPKAPAADGLSAGDLNLLAALKAKRLELARAQKVPPYVVFSDRSLIEMAAARPHRPVDMKAIHGVGDVKIERYSAAFLAVIAAHEGTG